MKWRQTFWATLVMVGVMASSGAALAQDKAAAGGAGGAAAAGGGKTAAAGAGEKGFVNTAIRSVSTLNSMADPDNDWYGLNMAQTALYTGIVPGMRDGLPHINRFRRAAERSRRTNRLTWIGYQRMADKTRVFIQTGKPAAYNVARGSKPGELLIVLQNTSGSLRNFRRTMDARWYPRSVSSIRSYGKGRSTTVKIDLKLETPFQVTADGNYIYIDFNDSGMDKGLMPTKGDDTLDNGDLTDPDNG